LFALKGLAGGTFELTDAVMLTREAYCLADLSQCPIFRPKEIFKYPEGRDVEVIEISPEEDCLHDIFVEARYQEGTVLWGQEVRSHLLNVGL
jgi:hypothetical protein